MLLIAPQEAKQHNVGTRSNLFQKNPRRHTTNRIGELYLTCTQERRTVNICPQEHDANNLHQHHIKGDVWIDTHPHHLLHCPRQKHASCFLYNSSVQNRECLNDRAVDCASSEPSENLLRVPEKQQVLIVDTCWAKYTSAQRGPLHWTCARTLQPKDYSAPHAWQSAQRT